MAVGLGRQRLPRGNVASSGGRSNRPLPQGGSQYITPRAWKTGYSDSYKREHFWQYIEQAVIMLSFLCTLSVADTVPYRIPPA